MAPYQVGDYVKVELADEANGASEWLWVRVERFNQGRRVMSGRLDSHPVVFASELRHGQEVAVSFEKVREHRRPQDF
jgi:hypothetical protein